MVAESTAEPPGQRAPDVRAGGVPPGGYLGRTFESLAIPHFRYLWLGSLIGMGGMQMQTIARTILVDDLTNSAFITGIVAMGFAPTMLIFSLFGGVAGDKMERRGLIQASQGAAGLLALVIGVLIAAGAIHWTHMLAASMVQGVLFAFQMPARMAALPVLVGGHRLTNAIALNSGGMALMAIAGPSVAGVIYGAFGAGVVYFVVAGMYGVAVLMTGRIPKIPPEVSGRGQNMLRDVVAGVRYVGSNRPVLLLLASGGVIAVLAMPFRMLLPVFARRLYDSDPSEIGWLLALGGAGGILGTLAVAGLREGQRRGLILLVGSILSGVALLVIGGFPTYAVGLAAMIGVGLAETTRMTVGQSLALENTGSQYRGRVMSLNMMTFGLMPLGALPLGRAVDVYGAQPSLLVVAGLVMVAGVVFLIVARTLRQLS